MNTSGTSTHNSSSSRTTSHNTSRSSAHDTSASTIHNMSRDSIHDISASTIHNMSRDSTHDTSASTIHDTSGASSHDTSMDTTHNTSRTSHDISNVSETSFDDSEMDTPTRMSWFLAEADEGLLNGGDPTGVQAFCILHAMELLETDVTDKYLTRFVHFRVNNKEVEGKLAVAADERSLVDAAMYLMKKERDMARNTGPTAVVQYMVSGSKLIHELVAKDKICWPNDEIISIQPAVTLNGGQEAIALHFHEKRDYMEKVMLDMKSKCFNFSFNDKLLHSVVMTNKMWLLLQFSPKPEIIIYAIVNYGDTIWQEQNMFKDVVAYILHDEIVVQAIVISYSTNRDELELKLESLKEFCLEIDIPNPHEIDEEIKNAVVLFKRRSAFQRAEERDETGEHRAIRRDLEIMMDGMQSEANTIISAFEMVESISKNIESHINSLDLSKPTT